MKQLIYNDGSLLSSVPALQLLVDRGPSPTNEHGSPREPAGAATPPTAPLLRDHMVSVRDHMMPVRDHMMPVRDHMMPVFSALHLLYEVHTIGTSLGDS